MTCKTDWTAEDYYNLEDHNRIVANLNLVSEMVIPIALIPIPSASMGQHLTLSDRNTMRDRFNAIMLQTHTGVTLVTLGTNWFGSVQLNTMEYWLEYVSHKYLEDSGKAVIVDAAGQAVVMAAKGYRSAFTGQQIDALVSLGGDNNNG